MDRKNCAEQYKAYRRSKIKLIVVQILMIVVFLGLWELLTRLEVLNEFLFSKPTSILALLKKYYLDNNLFNHIFISVYETLLGVVIGSAGGILIAALLWWSKRLSKLLDPFMIVLNALPKTALAPIMIIWAGTGVKGIVVVAISILLVITIISTYNYFSNIEEEKVRMMRSFGATKYQIFTKYVLPSNLLNIISVIKINIGMAWVGVIVGEYLASRSGIGHLIMYGGQVFRFDLVMMGVFILAICALLMYGIVNLIEKFFIKRREKEG